MRWVGETVFMLQGYPTPDTFPWDQAPPPPPHGPEPEPSPEGPQQEDGNGGDDATQQEDVGGPAGNGPREETRQAGGSQWRCFREEGLSEAVEKAAYHYIQTIDDISDAEPATWRKIRAAGDALLSEAGSVEAAGKSLWIAREILGRHNLQGVDDAALDELLHPDILDYLREIRRSGMPARYVGPRERIKTKPHPRARACMGQVYRQLMKDIVQHRVLVVDADHTCLSNTVSSPFEAVPKMLPNRTISTDVRLVHDQRRINAYTHKDWHPPAVQPLHQQIVRRILFLKARYPGVGVSLAKKDVAGAFRLLWVDPRDIELFGGEVPWEPKHMGSQDPDNSKAEAGDPAAVTMLYLVSSFGFSGSPGEWNVWGRATEELHRQHRPAEPRRDGGIHFDGKILVDDMVLVEPNLGLRPWISSEVYEGIVVKLLGAKAVNAAKDAEEGFFAPSQIVWGVKIDADTERMSLPEARITKGAYLLNASDFNYGQKTLTLKDLQRFRGIATGWTTIVPGLKNELKAADVFLGGVEGGAPIQPGKQVRQKAEIERAWEDLWALFEDCRWLCTRSETWSEKFGGDIREVLPPLERLSLPGQHLKAAVFVSSDATLEVLGAIDWTHGDVCREKLADLRPWIQAVLEAEGCEDGGKLAIHIGEMLSFVAFACKQGPKWVGKVVVYGGDNKVVYNWIVSRKSGVKAGRILIRVLNLIEMRFRCQVLGGWWRTFHNEDADAVTRLTLQKYEELVCEKGWTKTDIKPSIRQALEDTERFGPCFLSWADGEDRNEQMRLHELRIFRAIHRNPAHFGDLQISEWVPGERVVKDFEFYQKNGCEGPRVIMGSIGPDPHGQKVRKFWAYLDEETFSVAMLEGPREVKWEVFHQLAQRMGFQVMQFEYLTSELGEAMVRRRIALFAHRSKKNQEEADEFLVRAVTPAAVGTTMQKGAPENFVKYHKYEPAMGQGQSVMLPVVGAHVWLGPETDRKHVYRLGGPMKWPLAGTMGAFEPLFVVDKAAPAGHVRQMTAQEVWQAQGRGVQEFYNLAEHYGEETVEKDGNHATGRRTALALLGVAGELATEELDSKVGMCMDVEDYKSLSQILVWLRRWRRGEFGRADPDRRAGGAIKAIVWLWGEDLWLDALDQEETEEVHDRKAGGRRGKELAERRQSEKVVNLQPGLSGDLNVQAQVEEWLEEHMDGDKAKSTKRAYQSAWEKWCDWSRRQGWPTPYLSYKEDAGVTWATWDGWGLPVQRSSRRCSPSRMPTRGQGMAMLPPRCIGCGLC